MANPPVIPKLLRVALAAGLAGILASLPLLFRETTATFAIFLYAGQPLAGLGVAAFAAQIFYDVKYEKPLHSERAAARRPS